MDKDATSSSNENKSSDEIDEVNQINFEDLIKGDEETTKTKDNENKLLFGDPLSISAEEEIAAEKILKRGLPSPIEKEESKTSTPTAVGSKSIIVATTSNNNVIQNKVLATTTPSGYVKIAPRSTTTTALSSLSNGKIIYLHRSGGSGVPVRVPASIATNASATNPSKQAVAIHVIRAPDGSLVPVKGGKSINIPNVSQLAGKKIIATTGSGNSGQVFIKAPTKTITGPAMPGGSTTTTTTSLGSTVISPVEAAKPKVRQVISAKSVLPIASNGKLMMQSTSGSKHVTVPQNVIKLSPNTAGGQLQAVQIPGKPGLQYVRVLKNTSGITHKITASDSTPTPKYTLVRQTKPPMKIMVKSPINDRERKMLTTVPTLRKINEATKPRDGGEGNFTQSPKIFQINTQIRQFSNSSDGRNASNSLIRNQITSQNQKIIQQRQEAAANLRASPPRKLYSVLKSTIDHKDVKLKARAEPVPSKPPLPTVTTSAPATGRSSRSSPPPSDDSSVTIRRKHCNCTKSQCLKLYCDCFANGEFCQDCNCKDCLNNLDNEDERQKAIRICLERNPNSFKPKITAATNESDQRLHNKGCNCKRSGCLKNYCECYEAKIPCSSNCKCMGCRNVEDHPDLDMDLKKCPIPTVQAFNRLKRPYDDTTKSRTPTSTTSSVSASVAAAASGTAASGAACGPTAEKQPCNFITQEVVDATIQCLIAQADECKKGALTPTQTEKMVMEELGRCLVEIIDFSIRNTDQN